MITFVRSVEEAAAATGTYRAGGTDLMELRRHGVHSSAVLDLQNIEGLDQIEEVDGGFLIGAKTTLRQLGEHPGVLQRAPGVHMAALGLATPQIRARATLGGSLFQQVRCWYYRSPQFRCAKKGGFECLARRGEARFHSLLDHGRCIAPHPSTMAMALMAYEATAVINGHHKRPLAELFSGGQQAANTHELLPDELLTGVFVPVVDGEVSAYHRTIHRSRAEWPLVEVCVRARGTVKAPTEIVVGIGGISNRPLVGRAVNQAALLELCEGWARVDLAQAAYKAKLVWPTVEDTLKIAFGER